MNRPATIDRVIQLRRDLHRHPEPAWREFYTTARIVEELERIGIDEIHVGPEIHSEEHRKAVPDAAEIESWRDRALEAGASTDLLGRMGDGYTGAVAVLRQGEGPTIGLRVDIDGLERSESEAPDHVPMAEGFRSENEGMMHACGHDAHAAIGVGVLEAVRRSDFEGTLKVFFQPGEEKGAGALPMAESGHVEDVEYLLAIHVGMGFSTGTIVPDISAFFAVSDARVEFTGESAHAGGKPNEGRNAVRAMTTAVENLHAIPRHEGGATRINVAPVGGGTATNVIAESAYLEFEVRGESNDLLEHMEDHAERIVEEAADLHECDVSFDWRTRLPSAHSNQAITQAVERVASANERVDSIDEYGDAAGSEDATILMRRVQENGGLAAYVGIGTDHPGGHHTATFDVDEDSISIGVEVLSETFRELAEGNP